MRSLYFLTCLGLLASPAWASAGPANVVTDWSAIVQEAIHNASEPRPPAGSQVLHTIVQLAMYDAAVAIEGGYEPYAADISAPAGADVRAAVATAAYHAARRRVAASQHAYLGTQYDAYMAGIPEGQSRTDGVQVGEAAAAAILAVRAHDGFDRTVLYECSNNSKTAPAGEFEPNAGCGTQPVDAKLAQVRPFTFSNPAQFRPAGPHSPSSNAYRRDFVETRDYGRSDSSVRSAEQTDVAYFWSEHTYVHWNRNLLGLVTSLGLGVRDSARFLAIVHTASADAIIAGFEAKYHFRFWRPRTAIPRADSDGNPRTDPDPGWVPLLQVNHPEYPSAHSFWSTALVETVASLLGTRSVEWTLQTSSAAVPQLIATQRSYRDLDSLLREIEDARVWAGLHWRHSMHDGAQLGRLVARHVLRFFRPGGTAALPPLFRLGSNAEAEKRWSREGAERSLRRARGSKNGCPGLRGGSRQAVLFCDVTGDCVGRSEGGLVL